MKDAGNQFALSSVERKKEREKERKNIMTFKVFLGCNSLVTYVQFIGCHSRACTRGTVTDKNRNQKKKPQSLQ